MNTANKRFFILIFIGALLPLIISWIYLKIYQLDNDDLTLKNQGILFKQTITLNSLDLKELENFIDQDKWIFLQVFNHHCQNECAKRVGLISNMVLSLGKNSQRINSVIIYPNGEKKRLELSLEDYDQHNKLIVMEAKKIDSFLQVLNQSIERIDNPISLFIVDPLGRFVLAFDNHLNYKQINQDWKILLKSSLIG